MRAAKEAREKLLKSLCIGNDTVNFARVAGVCFSACACRHTYRRDGGLQIQNRYNRKAGMCLYALVMVDKLKRKGATCILARMPRPCLSVSLSIWHLRCVLVREFL
jgi:hypothetical protein